VDDLEKWLTPLGLAALAPTLRANDIDLEILPALAEADLERLGLSLGHRRKLLRAAASLPGFSPSPSPSPSVERASTESPRTSAERRQLTVMFVDLVGSTALSARLDPEDMREIIGAYHRCCAEHITKAGGFVAKYMGDGVLTYFGYPEAHEDDAERAVRSAIALIDAVPRLPISHNAVLAVRVGIATGLVVVGDLIGEGDARERGVVGDTPNLAARLQGIAEPNTVVIADSTRALLGNLFELEDLGLRDLKGIAGPVRAWVPLRETAVESRFEALHATRLIALVGRAEEFEALHRRWQRAKPGEGQVVLLSGEAGIGKSRLTAELLKRLAADPHTRLRYFCSPQHTDSAFYPIIGQMQRAAGHAQDDPSKARLDKLDAVLAQTSTSIQDAALFAEMLSLPNDGRYPALELAPQQRRQRTLEALTAQLVALASRQPVLMIFEDVHWIDPTSLEALSRAIDRVKTLPVLLIVTFRPEFNAPWVGQSHVTSLTLNRLGERDAAGIVARLVGGKGLPSDVLSEIVERTDGIPLFVEEMTKAVLEAESEGAARRTVAAAPRPGVAVPASLQASLMARLDRLGPAKEVAQIGAAIGREFSHALLAAVMRRPEAELGLALDRLIAAGLLFRQGVPPHATYLFKHALVQDAAYGTLLREPRRALHAHIAEILESLFADVAENQPELLARHYTEAGAIEKSASLWGKAGQRSLTRSALLEAAEQLTRALDQIATLAATPALRREQIKLQIALANALMHTQGYAAPETQASLDRARLYIERAKSLGEPPEDPFMLYSVLYGVWVANATAFNGDIIRDLAAQFLAMAKAEGATIPLIMGHRMMGRSLIDTGELAEGRSHCDQAMALYDPAKHRSVAMRFGQEAGISIRSFRSYGTWLLGYPETALIDAGQAINDARNFGQAGTLMFALSHVPLTYIHCGDYATAKGYAEELVRLAEEKRALYWKAWGTTFRGCVLALTAKNGEDYSNATQMIASGLAAFRSAGATIVTTFHLSHLARAYAGISQYDDAWRCIEEAMAFVEIRKERWYEAELHRIAGDIALRSPQQDAVKAQGYFERALAIARQQQAKSWELRAAMSMARLWRDQGKRTEARDLLAPVYGWFTEGFDTLDLKEARALLDELASEGSDRATAN
jgi:class 3 adenylate cyclase/predicted ATPase